MANYHVTKRSDGDWNVKQEGSTRASIVAETQAKAERAAKDFATNSGGGEVRIHGIDGKIRDSDTVSPAKDPFPPKDKKH